MTRICHLSSAHRGLDVRIYQKECVSLAAAGYDVHLVIVATSEEVKIAQENGVTLHALRPPKGRLSRMALQALTCYRIARVLDAKIYHFHDPELITFGVLLALSGKKVIYDVHEDVPEDILSKDWISPWIRKPVSALVAGLEKICSKHFFSVSAATPFIAKRFLKITPRTIDVNNFPMLDELATDVAWDNKHVEVCYVGGIAKIRGISEVCEAMGLVQTNARLNLCGRFSEAGVEQSVKAMSGWQTVNELGVVDRSGVRDVLSRSVAGLVTFHPLPNHVDAQPNKMFEYMSAGIPVIASDFPLWREIIQGNDCGLLVDPLDPAAIAQAIDYLMSNPAEAKRMGANGRKAVNERYNWAIEEQKLFAFYERTLSQSSS